LRHGNHQERVVEIEADALSRGGGMSAGSVIERTERSYLCPQGRKKSADLVCFSHLRWDLVFQRPQHLMTRFAQNFRVFYMEEPLPIPAHATPRMQEERRENNLIRVIPHLPEHLDEHAGTDLLQDLVDEYMIDRGIDDPILWYYTPMALTISHRIRSRLTVYDCMDELSAFAGAPPGLIQRERELMRRADLVFAGGYSLYEAKRPSHDRVFAFPSSVDVGHFRRAREPLPEPEDQAGIPHPRIGHYAVLDERLDLELLAAVADLRPDWHFVMVGPVVKIDPETLPRRPNIHYLGRKEYSELPAYLAGWDATFMPFALNDSTRFISPTKTPEYLAAGRKVVSTPVRDVVRTWGSCGLVEVASTPDQVAGALEKVLAHPVDRKWLARVDEKLALMSWDATCARMQELLA
jgi:glycosyltransferase involved in cell wall biosynthesis